MCISSGRKGEAKEDYRGQTLKGPVFSNQELELPRAFLGAFPSASAVKAHQVPLSMEFSRKEYWSG